MIRQVNKNKMKYTNVIKKYDQPLSISLGFMGILSIVACFVLIFKFGDYNLMHTDKFPFYSFLYFISRGFVTIFGGLFLLLQRRNNLSKFIKALAFILILGGLVEIMRAFFY
ncbi:MAG: hypothetical protein DWQ05_17015 [Calditrichaeota bacterium]|nr:MAG: hypothetical protein DWQ05_17015 [Calditrichota bacterium]